ncbi:MAG TPA: M67 family metallopeptidase [Anaerolineales bacterium]|nr:M67 family metallopeptidase [Anaerolineales bacterium]
MISQLGLSQEQFDEMLEHVKDHAPLEACGLLAGKDVRVEKVIPVRNQAQSPIRFVMDPYEQLRAFDWIDSQGLDLIGIFHSHPAGPEAVSVTDIEEAAYEVVHVIWSQTGDQWKMRGFWIQGGQVQEVTLSVRDR